MSYCVLEAKGIRLAYDGDNRFLVTKAGEKIVAVHKAGHLLVIRGTFSAAVTNALFICNVAEESAHMEAHSDTLYRFHIRMGHLHYDAVEALANKPGSGIVLTDT